MAAKEEKIKNIKIIITSAAVCALFFNITERELRRWKANGCPVEGHGLWNLKRVFDWWEDNINSSKAEDGDRGLKEIKKGYWSHRSRREKVLADTAENSVLPFDELDEAWISQALTYRSGLLALADRLPPLLVGKKQVPMKKIIKDEAKLLLAALSRDTKTCPSKNLPKNYQNLDTRFEKTKELKND